MTIENKKIHFIGIGGFGMSGLAEYFLKHGNKVSGSDLSTSALTQQLETRGARISYEHSENNIAKDVDLVIYTSAVKDDNPEFIAAKELGCRMLKRAEILGEIVNGMYLIAVSGTHGKTTTTAMIGNALAEAGLDPLVFVGGNVASFNNSTFRMGTGNYAVVEADEYDRSFLTLTPDITVITNIDEDHLDIYDDLDDIKDTFVQFLNGAKENSMIIYCGDDKDANEVVERSGKSSRSYGFEQNNYYKITDYKYNGVLNFTVKNTKKEYADIKINLPGKHNMLNASACLAVANELKIDFRKLKKSLSGFVTVERRMQLKYDVHEIKIYDDYAHHPDEIASSLKALREFNPNRWLIAVFQPHLFTRTRDFYREFAEKLSLADDVIITDIYPAREKPIPGVTSNIIFNELRKTHSHSVFLADKHKLMSYLISNIKPNDTVVFMGAGDITNICDQFIVKLKSALS